ncbi:helix-turn-helix transcriptional regulator [Coprococcus eutactus]|jgi:predicted DNA-binding transcriptional regulator YafY|uniref:helix-turn-helix transcriptional regulator n=1 Tax=Coprococcus eutactus TaxID=33043 RepID=UPI00321B085B
MDNKKMIVVNIIEILKKYTDENHVISQKEIIDILEKEYDMTADRKTVKRNIDMLIDCGYSIGYTEKARSYVDKNTGEMIQNNIVTGYYLERDFTEGELRLLVDAVLFSRQIPNNQKQDLVKKLDGLASKYFSSRIKYLATERDQVSYNGTIFYNIEVIDEAIEKNRKIRFKYMNYDVDKKPHKKTRQSGEQIEYLVTPYRMAAKEGKYYLICNFDKYDDISNYRIDRICDIEITDEIGKPFNKLQGSDGRKLNINQYMNEHIYMFAGENRRIKFRINKPMISDVLDVLGHDVTMREDGDSVIVTATVNEQAMIQYAKSFAPDVVVLEPEDIVQKIKDSLREAVSKYEQ